PRNRPGREHGALALTASGSREALLTRIGHRSGRDVKPSSSTLLPLRLDAGYGRLGRLEEAHHHGHRTDAHGVPVREWHGRLAPRLAEEGAVLAAEVLDRRSRLRHQDPSVAPGHAGIVDADRGTGIAADDRLAGVERHAVAA